MSLAKDSGAESIDEDKQAAKENSDDATVYFDRGVDYLKSGMYKEAIEEFKQATEIDPDYAKAHKTLGYVYLNFYMNKEAIETIKVAIERDPEHAMSYYNLGVIYNLSNDKDSALEQHEILNGLDFDLADQLFRLIKK
jgi:tetratricopeptide (TPR) repeat protein